MFHHHVRVPEEFFDEQPRGDAHSTKNSQHPDGAEKVERTSKIFQQEADGDQVKEYPEGTRDSVVRNSTLAINVTYRHFTDGSAVPRRQGRNEPVQFTVKRNLLENFATIGFERGAEVVNVHIAQLGHQPIGATRRDAAKPEIIDSLLAPAADNIVTLGNFF